MHRSEGGSLAVLLDRGSRVPQPGCRVTQRIRGGPVCVSGRGSWSKGQHGLYGRVIAQRVCGPKVGVESSLRLAFWVPSLGAHPHSLLFCLRPGVSSLLTRAVIGSGLGPTGRHEVRWRAGDVLCGCIVEPHVYILSSNVRSCRSKPL